MKQAEALGAELILSCMELPGRGRVTVYKLGGVEHGMWETP